MRVSDNKEIYSIGLTSLRRLQRNAPSIPRSNMSRNRGDEGTIQVPYQNKVYPSGREQRSHYRGSSSSLTNSLNAVTPMSDEEILAEESLPELFTAQKTSITTRAGQAASFTCIVRNIGNRQVGQW